MLLEAVAGVLAGGIHAVSGPDHLAAVAPVAARHAESAGRLGFRWGLGHALGAMALGAAGWLLREAVSLELWSELAERSVGILLVGIGLWALRRATQTRVHAHEHAHDGSVHSHVHIHGSGGAHDAHGPHATADVAAHRAHAHTHAAFAIGALHGVAGTAHLVGVLPALAIPSASGVGAYLLGYGLGATAAMGAFGWLVGAIARRSRRDGTRLYRGMLSATGGAAIVTGIAWIVV